MTEIERLAREAGCEEPRGSHPGMLGFYPAQLERFAALVRAEALEEAAVIVLTMRTASTYNMRNEIGKARRDLKA